MYDQIVCTDTPLQTQLLCMQTKYDAEAWGAVAYCSIKCNMFSAQLHAETRHLDELWMGRNISGWVKTEGANCR